MKIPRERRPLTSWDYFCANFGVGVGTKIKDIYVHAFSCVGFIGNIGKSLRRRQLHTPLGLCTPQKPRF
jgi:hypothetical protein